MQISMSKITNIVCIITLEYLLVIYYGFYKEVVRYER